MRRAPSLRLGVPHGPGAGAEPIRIEYASTGAGARLVQGSPAEIVPDMIGRLFAICSEAQQLASWLALCAAQGREPDPGQLAIRRRRVSLEALRETALHVLLVWPRFVQEPPLREAAAAIMAATRGEADLRQLEHVLAQAVFGCAPGPWLGDVATRTVSRPWVLAGQTQAARMLERAIGEYEVPIHPAPAADSPLGRCAHDTFVAGFETGSLAAHHGARLLELARLAAGFANGTPDLADCAWQATRDGEGRAEVACARGTLVHEVRLVEGRIAHYRLVSPTDNAFARFGAGAMWLQTVADGSLGWPLARREVILREVLAAIDPCVDYTLAFDGARAGESV